MQSSKYSIPFQNAKFIEVGNTNSVLDSISESLKKIPEKIISINPITTIPDFSEIESELKNIDPLKIYKTIDELNFFEFERLKNLYSIVKSRPSFKKILADRIIGINPHSDYLKLDY